MNNENQQVVIVGAGMAGLTAAAYLARENYQVLVLDKNARSGGLLSTFEVNGFFFDSGPRALINSGIVRPILQDLGIHWDYYRNKISVGIEDQLVQVNSMKDLHEYERMLVHLYPESQEEIRKIIRVINQISEHTRVLYEFDNPNFSGLMNDKNYIFKKLLPWMPKFLYALHKLNQFDIPMDVFIKRLTHNQSLEDIITQHFFRGTPTHFALGYFYVYLDYFYPKGGTGVLKNLLEQKVLELGAKIVLNKKIVEVIPSKSLVVDSEGGSYPYQHLIWAADLKALHRSINPVGLDPKTTRQSESEKNRILASKAAESVFIMHLAVNRPPSYFRNNGGEHFFYTPSRQGLGVTNREDRLRLIEDFDQKSRMEILEWLESYLDLNTYEISVPVLRDETLAPAGQTGLMISCLFDYQILRKIEQAGWYDEVKEIIENRIVSILSKTIYPGVDQDILFKFSSTPLTINKISGSSEGAITGWSFEKEPPVIYNLKNIPKSVLTPFPNIYQAGQWAYAPAGVPTAMLTGWYATQEIKKRSKKK